jgi:hypothetical protein
MGKRIGDCDGDGVVPRIAVGGNPGDRPAAAMPDNDGGREDGKEKEEEDALTAPNDGVITTS